MKRFFTAASLFTVLLLATSGCNTSLAEAERETASQELLNVSYDPTRELWREINSAFIPHYKKGAGIALDIKQSHAGSSSQARAVIDGLEADVVTLAMWADTNAIRKAGLINDGWEERLPNGSLPYSSTIVFVVRKGNPKGIKDWPDLVREGVEVITPSAKTSGNGKLSFLAAWGSVVLRGGSEQQALNFVTKLYQQVPVLDPAARGATTTFAQKKIGDVHLTWENEAYLEVKESGDELEIVYPSLSIRAEPRVAVVDGNVDRRQTRAAAEAYLKFLYTPEAQEIIAKNYYRPAQAEILAKYADKFGKIELFTIQQISEGWEQADKRFFAEGGVFDQIYSAGQAQK
jgi:sulfate transport system substrate-binding protein